MNAKIKKLSTIVLFTSLYLGCLSLSERETHDLQHGSNLNRIQLPQKQWNLVHFLPAQSMESLKIFDYLFARKALTTLRESETVVIFGEARDQEMRLASVGYKVIKFDTVAAADMASMPPRMMIIENLKRLHFSGNYYAANCGKYCRENDLMQLLRSKLRQHMDGDVAEGLPADEQEVRLVNTINWGIE